MTFVANRHQLCRGAIFLLKSYIREQNFRKLTDKGMNRLVSNLRSKWARK